MAVELDEAGQKIVIVPRAVDVEGVDETFARQLAEFVDAQQAA